MKEKKSCCEILYTRYNFLIASFPVHSYICLCGRAFRGEALIALNVKGLAGWTEPQQKAPCTTGSMKEEFKDVDISNLVSCGGGGQSHG